MADRANTVLKLSLAVAVLLAGGGVGFYYGIYLPAQDVRRQTRALAEKQEAQAAADRALAERAQREQAAQREYQGCIDFAEKSYRERWTAACQAQHDVDQAAYADCADDLFSTEQGCAADHPVRPVQDCALPAQTARSYAQARDARKQECLGRLQSAQAVGGSLSVRPATSGVPTEMTDQ